MLCGLDTWDLRRRAGDGSDEGVEALCWFARVQNRDNGNTVRRTQYGTREEDLEDRR